MKYILLSILLIWTYSPVFAATPTASSTPLPTLNSTANIDTVTTERVQAAIKKNRMLKNQAISAASHDGIVTLEGSVETKAQEESAIKTAKKVKGVVEVKSQLSIGHHGK